MARRYVSGLTWWQCEYCGYSVVTAGMVVSECSFCANQVVDCGDFAIRVRDER